jgi:hypothetical protein
MMAADITLADVMVKTDLGEYISWLASYEWLNFLGQSCQKDINYTIPQMLLS